MNGPPCSWSWQEVDSMTPVLLTCPGCGRYVDCIPLEPSDGEAVTVWVIEGHASQPWETAS